MTRHSLILALLLLVAAGGAWAAEEGIHISGGRAQPLTWQCGDGAGFVWDINQQGTVNDGTNDAYDGGMRLIVNGNSWNHNGPGMLSKDGREIEMGPWVYGAARVWRRIYVDAQIGYCRWIDIFENTSNSDQKLKLQYQSNLGSSTQYTYTTSGKADLTDKDWGIVTSDTTGESSRPALVHIYATRSAKLKPRFQWTRNNDNIYYNVDVKVPAGSTVALCFFEAQRRPYAEATKFLTTFRVENELGKVPPSLRRIILNMSSATAVLGGLELPRNEAHDIVIKRNGDELLGTILGAQYVVEDSVCGRLELPADRIVGVRVVDQAGACVKVGLVDGQVVVGKLSSGPIKFRMADGSEISLPAGSIQTAAYRLSEARPFEVAVSEPVLVLRSGQWLLFQDRSADFAFHTEYGDLKLKPSDLQAIFLDTPEGGLHRAVFRNGSVLSGMLVADELKLKLRLDRTIAVPRGAVEKIGFPAGAARAELLAELKLRNEDQLLGRIAEESLSVITRNGKVDVKAGDVADIVFSPALPNAGVNLTLHNGTKLTGRLDGQTMRFQVVPGPVVPVFVGHIVRVTCPEGPADGTPTTRPAAGSPKALNPAAAAEAAKLETEIREIKAALADYQAQMAQAARSPTRVRSVQKKTEALNKRLGDLEARLNEINK